MKLCNYQQYYFSRMLSLPSCFHEDKYFNTSKVGQVFEKHYVISNKTSMNSGKNTYKKQVCNLQRVSKL